MKNILVTGGAGYIGSHACKVLKENGYNPITYDNLCLGNKDFVKWGPLVIGDTHDSEKVAATIKEYNIDAVIHFAAFAYVGESVSDPAKYYYNNVEGTLGLLNGMRAAGCDKIVFSSTCAVYGEPEIVPINEQTPKAPVNSYGRSKLFCEGILADYARAYDLKYVALRYFNASGDDWDGQVGENREIETHLIPRAMMALQGYIDDFAVFGSDFPTKDGTAVRDYIHVLDLAKAHILALEYIAKEQKCGIFNLGVGTGYSVAEVLEKINEISGKQLPAPKGDRRPGDPPELVADASLARETLGFNPVNSSLDDIIKSAWNWHQKVHPAKG
jgi:UDP-arabinose 4-epimerase